MNRAEYKKQWEQEQAIAQMLGWDFSHIDGRYVQNDLPWDVQAIIKQYLQPQHVLLDMDTGGGEFLLSLKHPYENTYATEAYAPNVAYCQQTLAPLGIHFYEAAGDKPLPFAEDMFDIVTNRHGSYDVQEIYRILKPGGLFITQQVGEQNDRELVELLLPELPLPYPGWDLSHNVQAFCEAKFTILQKAEAYPEICFYDVGALVWFARIISWEFVGFSVEEHIEKLYQAQELLEQQGKLSGKAHRFMIVAKK